MSRGADLATINSKTERKRHFASKREVEELRVMLGKVNKFLDFQFFVVLVLADVMLLVIGSVIYLLLR